MSVSSELRKSKDLLSQVSDKQSIASARSHTTLTKKKKSTKSKMKRPLSACSTTPLQSEINSFQQTDLSDDIISLHPLSTRKTSDSLSDTSKRLNNQTPQPAYNKSEIKRIFLPSPSKPNFIRKSQLMNVETNFDDRWQVFLELRKMDRARNRIYCKVYFKKWKKLTSIKFIKRITLKTESFDLIDSTPIDLNNRQNINDKSAYDLINEARQKILEYNSNFSGFDGNASIRAHNRSYPNSGYYNNTNTNISYHSQNINTTPNAKYNGNMSFSQQNNTDQNSDNFPMNNENQSLCGPADQNNKSNNDLNHSKANFIKVDSPNTSYNSLNTNTSIIDLNSSLRTNELLNTNMNNTPTSSPNKEEYEKNINYVNDEFIRINTLIENANNLNSQFQTNKSYGQYYMSNENIRKRKNMSQYQTSQSYQNNQDQYQIDQFSKRYHNQRSKTRSSHNNHYYQTSSMSPEEDDYSTSEHFSELKNGSYINKQPYPNEEECNFDFSDSNDKNDFSIGYSAILLNSNDQNNQINSNSNINSNTKKHSKRRRNHNRASESKSANLPDDNNIIDSITVADAFCDLVNNSINKSRELANETRKILESESSISENETKFNKKQNITVSYDDDPRFPNMFIRRKFDRSLSLADSFQLSSSSDSSFATNLKFSLIDNRSDLFENNQYLKKKRKMKQ